MKVLRPFTLRVFSLLVIVYSLVGVIVAPNPLSTSATSIQPVPRAIPHTDVNPLGATFFLDREVETWKKEHTLRMAREAGIGWARQMFPWDQIEPKQQGRFWDDNYRKSTWEKFDEIVEMAQRNNLRVVARLDKPPPWARRNDPTPGALPVDLQAFGDYVYNVVERYKGKIRYYQIWNEPNLAAEWGDRPVNPGGYVALLRTAYERAKQADPNAVILSAPLAQTLGQGPLNLNEFDYLEAMYAAGSKGLFDILSANAYGFDRPPGDPPSRDVLNFQRVVLLHDIMIKNNDAGKAVWLNEFGWNAAPSGFAEDKLLWGRVTEEQQAKFTREAIDLARNWDWLGVIGLWYFRQVGDFLATDRAEYFFRIVDVDFTPRLVYYELQKLAPKYLVADNGLHEEISGAVETKGRWRSVMNPAASGGEYLASNTPGDSLSFTFIGTGLTLISTKGPRFGRATVTIDGAPARSLSKDRDGRTVLDFYHPAETFKVEDKVAAGLPLGKHTIQLVTLSEGPRDGRQTGAALDALEVENRGASFGLFYRHLGLFFISIVIFGSSFFIWRRR